MSPRRFDLNGKFILPLPIRIISAGSELSRCFSFGGLQEQWRDSALAKRPVMDDRYVYMERLPDDAAPPILRPFSFDKFRHSG
ncbi:hypothetical protein [Geomonas diazotrophica]|uniref:hypothetical protein n=1 Tax=Geomonas diazotrophica TaxID=2843197 RepID=UPI001C106D4F|nr:hypothetical protein [Geomonas diazotrophica]